MVAGILLVCDGLLARWIAFQYGLHVATSAHLGGFIFGSALGYLALASRYPVSPVRRGVVMTATVLGFCGLGLYGL